MRPFGSRTWPPERGFARRPSTAAGRRRPTSSWPSSTSAARSGSRVPDTGSLEGDLRRFARSIVDNLGTGGGQTLARTLVTAADGSVELRDAAVGFWARRFELASEMVARAVAPRRGSCRHRRRCHGRDVDRAALRSSPPHRWRARLRTRRSCGSRCGGRGRTIRRAVRIRVTPHDGFRVKDSGHGDQSYARVARPRRPLRRNRRHASAPAVRG